jgi:hypothetical protein
LTRHGDIFMVMDELEAFLSRTRGAIFGSTVFSEPRRLPRSRADSLWCYSR